MGRVTPCAPSSAWPSPARTDNRTHETNETNETNRTRGFAAPEICAGSDVEIDVDRECDGQGAGGGGEGPEEISLAGGEGEGGDDDAGLRGKHAVEKFRAAGMVLLGGDVPLADLQFIDAGDGLVQFCLGIVAGGGVGEAGGGEITENKRGAVHELFVQFIGGGVNRFGGGIESVGGIGGGRERLGNAGFADVGEVGGDFGFGPAIGEGGQGGFHAVVIFGSGDEGQLVFRERGDGGGIGSGQGGGGEGMGFDAGGEKIEGIVGEGAASFLGGGVAPLVTSLGLELGGGGAVVLGTGHFTGGESGQHGGDDGHHDGGGGEDLAPGGRWEIGFQGIGDLSFGSHRDFLLMIEDELTWFFGGRQLAMGGRFQVEGFRFQA